MNTIEEIRIKSKIKKLVNSMLKNMTLEDTLQTADTLQFCMRKLPTYKWEAFIDSELEAMKIVCSK